MKGKNTQIDRVYVLIRVWKSLRATISEEFQFNMQQRSIGRPDYGSFFGHLPYMHVRVSHGLPRKGGSRELVSWHKWVLFSKRFDWLQSKCNAHEMYEILNRFRLCFGGGWFRFGYLPTHHNRAYTVLGGMEDDRGKTGTTRDVHTRMDGELRSTKTRTRQLV